MGAMPTVAGREVFSIGESAYTWGDVNLGAVLRGDWAALARDVSASLSCLKRLEELEDEEEVLPEEEISAAAAEFRYARDLVAAEDMETWLEKCGLTADDWMDFIRRSLLIKKWAEELEEIQREYPVSQEEVDAIILCDATCSGRAVAWATALAARAAAYAKIAEEDASAGDGISEDEVRSVLDSLPAKGAAQALAGPAGPADPDRLAALARLEAAWKRFAARQATPQAIREQLAAHRLEWTRLTVRSLGLSDLEAAREAALCIREDGRDPAEVAAESGAEFREEDWYLDDADPALRDHLLAARAGEVLGPLRLNDRFVVVSVLGKQPPSENDPALWARAERVLLDRATSREVENRVRWNEPL